MGWEPDRYLQFSDERLRPAMDLLGRVPLLRPGRIVDLGCGAGNVTRLLAERWPGADITGLDSSPAMLERARSVLPGVRFDQAGVEHWEPEEPLDLLFSNAALHWVGDHESLFPRLVDALFPGVLAVQMPGNFDAPSHRLIRELAVAGVGGAGRSGADGGGAGHGRLPSSAGPLCTRLSLWETTYWQGMSGPSPVLDWLRGTTLLPYLASLDESGQAAFLAQLEPAWRRPIRRTPTAPRSFPFDASSLLRSDDVRGPVCRGGVADRRRRRLDRLRRGGHGGRFGPA
jgi:trans-aconitate 2-methyltransferase